MRQPHMEIKLCDVGTSTFELLVNFLAILIASSFSDVWLNCLFA
jgi:hypothetical protein